MKLGEAMYAAQQAEAEAAGPGAAGDEDSAEATSGEGVVDADFEEVDDDEQKNQTCDDQERDFRMVAGERHQCRQGHHCGSLQPVFGTLEKTTYATLCGPATAGPHGPRSVELFDQRKIAIEGGDRVSAGPRSPILHHRLANRLHVPDDRSRRVGRGHAVVLE